MNKLEDYPEPLSFKYIKIDYNHCLGEGAYSKVYPVFRRPQNEIGLLSHWFPYIYDNIFRIDKKSEEEADLKNLCVKIRKSIFTVLFESKSHIWTRIIIEPMKEKRTNELLRKYNFSKIKFHNTESLFAQFKTRVNGHTLRHYIINDYFTNKNEFDLRKAFVHFLKIISNKNVRLYDMHADNIMYDEEQKYWEIVDGYAQEVDDLDEMYNIEGIRSYLFLNKIQNYVFNRLVKIAGRKNEYNEKKEYKLFRKMETIS